MPQSRPKAIDLPDTPLTSTQHSRGCLGRVPLQTGNIPHAVDRNRPDVSNTNVPGQPGGDATGNGSSEPIANKPSRYIGVHSILNPPTSSSDGREAKPSTAPSYALPPTLPSPQSRKRSETASNVQELNTTSATAGGRTGRRMLTPKSPGQRAASLARSRNLSTPSVEGSARPGDSSVYRVEPGASPNADIPPLPPLPNPGRPYPQNGSVPVAAPQSNMISATQHTENAHGSARPASRASHTTQYSNTRAPTPQPGARAYGGSNGGGFKIESAASLSHEHYASNHGGYQLSLDTESGPMIVPVEVDTGKASKLADEKRRRNAGASARFRARRKEKEKEASQTIAGLQQDLRDLADQRDFYLQERNYFREIVSRQHGVSTTAGRPPSPAREDSPLLIATSVESSRYDSAPDMAGSAGSTLQRQNSRREFPTPYPTAPSSSPPTTHFPPPYQGPTAVTLPPPSSLSSAPQPPPNLAPFTSPRQLHRGPPEPGNPQTYDLFRRDVRDRSWNAGP